MELINFPLNFFKDSSKIFKIKRKNQIRAYFRQKTKKRLLKFPILINQSSYKNNSYFYNIEKFFQYFCSSEKFIISYIELQKNEKISLRLFTFEKPILNKKLNNFSKEFEEINNIKDQIKETIEFEKKNRKSLLENEEGQNKFIVKMCLKHENGLNLHFVELNGNLLNLLKEKEEAYCHLAGKFIDNNESPLIEFEFESSLSYIIEDYLKSNRNNFNANCKISAKNFKFHSNFKINAQFLNNNENFFLFEFCFVGKNLNQTEKKQDFENLINDSENFILKYYQDEREKSK